MCRGMRYLAGAVEELVKAESAGEAAVLDGTLAVERRYEDKKKRKSGSK